MISKYEERNHHLKCKLFQKPPRLTSICYGRQFYSSNTIVIYIENLEAFFFSSSEKITTCFFSFSDITIMVMFSFDFEFAFQCCIVKSGIITLYLFHSLPSIFNAFQLNPKTITFYIHTNNNYITFQLIIMFHLKQSSFSPENNTAYTIRLQNTYTQNKLYNVCRVLF